MNATATKLANLMSGIAGPNSALRLRTVAVLLPTLAVTYAAETAFNINENLYKFLKHGARYDFDALFLCCVISLVALLGLKVKDLEDEAFRRRQAEQAAVALAHHDPLTGIGNRRKLEEALAQMPAGESRAVLMIDLNDFKPINDVFGQAIGDQVLQEAARRLQKVCNYGGTVCRLGGDEFALLTPAGVSREIVEHLAQAIAVAFDDPFHIESQCFQVEAAIGISLFETGSLSGPDVMRQADLALYRAKADGRIRFRMFEATMGDEMKRRATMERKLRRAIEQRTVEPYFQPLVDLASNELNGFEALARWTDSELGHVPPIEFVALAEETGLITALAHTLLEQACREAMRWPSHLKLSFNLSPKQLRDRLIVLRILAVLGETALRPERLEIEIPESALLFDQVRAREVIEGLRQAGVGVAIDGFGASLSSLRDLRDFHLDNLKIDRSLVATMQPGNASHAIVGSLLHLSAGLGLDATAAGIEREPQLAHLMAMGCRGGQGYLFGRAMPAAEVIDLIEQAGQPTVAA